jgi:hypothetical protein
MELRDWLVMLSLLIQALVFGAIFRKAGYTALLGLLMWIPLVNLCVLVWFTTADWPLEAGATRPSESSRSAGNWDFKMALKQAVSVENQGAFREALLHYRHALDFVTANHPSAEPTREKIRFLTAKLETPAA